MKSQFKTIPYQGSKAKLLTFIETSLNNYLEEYCKGIKLDTFFDAFSGSGRVANHFKEQYNVITNDKQAFSKVINDTYLNSNADSDRISELVKKLNNLDQTYFFKTDGWFTKTYSQDYLNGTAVSSDGSRKVWLTKNAKKIDMIRHKIDTMESSGGISSDEKNVLLTSLLNAANLVANTLGHQNGYLKEWSKRSLNDIVLQVPEFYSNERNHKNFCGDIFETLGIVESDITYFDPPYGSNNKNVTSFSYSAYYHLNNTLVLNNKPDVFGKASRPIETKGVKDSIEKNKKEIVIPEFVSLIKQAKTNLVCFSYSSQGLLNLDDFKQLFNEAGCNMNTYKVYVTGHKKNQQCVASLKSGEWINRNNHESELLEYFIICKKQNIHDIHLAA